MERKTIDLEQGWDYMQTGITKLKRILEGLPEPQFDSEQYMMLYTTIYNMCTQKPPHDYSQQLYDKYREAFEEYINSTVLPALKEKHDEYMLRELVKRWSNHKVMVRWLSRFFYYLDRYFIARRSLPPLNEVGLTCFRDRVYNELHSKVKDAVIALVDKEREGEQIDRALLKNVLDIYVEIGMGQMERYEVDFESFMLLDSASYYSRKASSWIQEDSCPDYMLKSEECLKKERERVAHYLHSSSEPKLVEKVQHELLVVYANQLLEKEHSGCRALLRDDKVDDLSRMYRLYHKIAKGLEPVANIFKQHVTAEGNALVQQAEDTATNQAANTASVQEQVLIRKVIELHDKYMVYVVECFQNHTLFHKALKEAFEIFCNKTVAGSSSAELLATFCDNILKKGGSEKLSDEAIEDTLEKVVKLLAYISDKDLFAEFYRKKLARRLLFDRSANDDHERSILTKLKQQCGGQFTSKMEGMVTDLTLARENQTSFEEYLGNNPAANPGIDLTVTVLTTGFWPSYKSFDINLPSEMVKCVEVFKGFYETKTKHRKLTWIYSLGTCHLNGKFDHKPIELVVSTYQAAVLLLFNTTDKLSYNDILTQLNLSHEDLVRLLHSLSCARYKILVKEPSTKTVSQTDSFEFNAKFTDRMRRIKIPLPPVDERKKVVEDVDKDRRYAIDAAIVRIMKSRKVLGHQQLVSECVEQLSRMFKPDIKAIKKRMEDLITRDYLERDKEMRSPSHTHTHALMTLAFSSSAATVAVASATVTSSARVPTLRGFVSFRLTAKKLPLRSHGGGGVRAMSELVQDKEPVVAATTSFTDAEDTTPSDLNHSRTFLDARTEQDLIDGIRKEKEAGTLPPNVASGMEELYWNYKTAVLSSGASGADETVISNMSLAFDRMLLGVEHPYTFNPYHKAIREPFDYFHFVHTYIRPLIDFKNSYVGNASIFSELEDKIRQGHNIVLISNHQSEADPAVISLLLEAQCPYIGENIKCVAGDRVITDPLCKPFSMGRNLICVYSKNHMNDDPELVDMKRKANTRSLKEMATLLRSGSQLIWIAPSGGRDRPNPSTGEWFPAPFDPSSVDNMRRLVEHSGTPGHIYPMSLLCYDIMPPPPKVEKEIGERRLVGFHGTGLSVAPEISFSDVTADCNNPNEAKEAYSQALYKSVNEQYKTLNFAIKHRRGIEASTSTVSLSQPWNESLSV